MESTCLGAVSMFTCTLAGQAAAASCPAGTTLLGFAVPQVVINIAGFAVPMILSPVAVWVLRPLFAIFLREGSGLVGNDKKPKSLCEAAAHYIALFNVITFLVAWCATFGCCLLEGPHILKVGLAIAGVLAGLAVTIRLVKELAELSWEKALMAGLVTFGGGNLPLIIGLPLYWLLR